MEPVVAMVLRMESVYLIESATSTPAAREEVAALAYEVAASCSGWAAAQCRLVHLDGPLDGPIELWLGLTPPSTSLRVVGGGGVRTTQCADGGARDRHAAPSDEGVGGVVVDEDGQVDGGAPEGELEVAVPHLV